MRLIDADDYKERYKDIIDCEIDHPKYQDTLKELIDSMQTILEANKAEQTAEWKLVTKPSDMFAGYRCSNCTELVYGKTNYCPNCGARMKGV